MCEKSVHLSCHSNEPIGPLELAELEEFHEKTVRHFQRWREDNDRRSTPLPKSIRHAARLLSEVKRLRKLIEAGTRYSVRVENQLPPRAHRKGKNIKTTTVDFADIEQRLYAMICKSVGEWPGSNLTVKSRLDHVRERVSMENERTDRLRDRVTRIEQHLAKGVFKGKLKREPYGR